MGPTPPFRADHVGSLLRPAALREARAEHAAGRIDDEHLRAVEDDAIRELIRRQQEVGLRSATDGEFRRESWHMDFAFELAGTAHQGSDHSLQWHSEDGVEEWGPPGIAVVDRIHLDDTIFADAFTFLRDNAGSSQPKLTIPSPNVVSVLAAGAVDPEVYDDDAALWADLSAAYSDEIARLGELGCTYLQLDDTSLAHINDPQTRERIAAQGGDPLHQHEAFIANLNSALAGRPSRITVTTHLCRGNYRSMWLSSGGYDFVAEALFNELDVDGYFLEFDDERSGTFEPLRFVPPGKRVVLGLVTTKRPELEERDALMRRIEEASRYIDVDQLCLSPQCGFASTEEGNALSADDQFAKLRLIVETADEVWGDR